MAVVALPEVDVGAVLVAAAVDVESLAGLGVDDVEDVLLARIFVLILLFFLLRSLFFFDSNSFQFRYFFR